MNKGFLEKRQNLSVTYDTKRPFMYKQFYDMRFWQICAKMFSFCEKFCENRSKCASTKTERIW